MKMCIASVSFACMHSVQATLTANIYLYHGAFSIARFWTSRACEGLYTVERAAQNGSTFFYVENTIANNNSI